jgi:hypothetical protein
MFQYKPKHFATHELVPPKMFEERGDKALHLLNPQVLELADLLREIYGPTFINTYNLGENVIRAYKLREWSGIRTPDSKWYRPYSQHTFGNALDMVFRDVTAEQVRSDIIDGVIELPYPVVLEKSVSWIHIACANYYDNITLVGK